MRGTWDFFWEKAANRRPRQKASRGRVWKSGRRARRWGGWGWSHLSVGENLVVRGVVVNLGHHLVEEGVGGSVEDDPGGALVVVIEHEDDRVAPPPLLRLGGEEQAARLRLGEAVRPVRGGHLLV